ncbi:unnamed protein product [Paramecium pentaurelia]|uniref:Uncharacterized protein n=1 Tax=Paramecium pentaurelia TaxID=43138 RepID=A0A8S1VTE5_9CILI|nr:unnamed protein product [Paramecium pentaurelia]
MILQLTTKFKQDLLGKINGPVQVRSFYPRQIICFGMDGLDIYQAKIFSQMKFIKAQYQPFHELREELDTRFESEKNRGSLNLKINNLIYLTMPKALFMLTMQLWAFQKINLICQMIIWSINQNNLCEYKQKLDGHVNFIRYVLINKTYDLIISGSDDRTIKFWQKKFQWNCKQTINDHNNRVLALCINEQQNKLIKCSEEIQYQSLNFQNQTEDGL